jgi:hypothetical protein
MDMVRSMLSNSMLPLGLWMEAKIAAHIINHVPSKSVPKTTYVLCTGRMASINYLHVWGCPTQDKIFNPQLRKLDPKTISCHFIGYPDKYKGYQFYCPDCNTKFVDTRHTVFLECDVSSSPREVDLEEIWTYAPPMTHVDFIPTTAGAPHVENAPLAKNDNSPAINLDTEPIINENVGASLVNEQEGSEENDAPSANDHEQEPQQENDDPQPTRRSQHERRSTISNDYVVYMSEDVNNMEKMDDHVSFKEAMKSENSQKWCDAMEEEPRSMSSNNV